MYQFFTCVYVFWCFNFLGQLYIKNNLLYNDVSLMSPLSSMVVVSLIYAIAQAVPYMMYSILYNIIISK